MTDTLDPREDRQKSERVAVRLTPAIKRALERGAEVSGRSLSDFVVDSAYRAAQRAIEDHERVHLSDQDRKVFLAALDKPPGPNQALRRAAQRHRRLTGD
jgi:uncharacterized protein (DUF1778 family)